MRHTPRYIVEDSGWVSDLLRATPWATIVSPTSAGLVASHYPVVLEEDVEGISLVSHVGRPDDELHQLGEQKMLVVIQGPHGYVSPSVDGGGENVPTWDHVTAHRYGVPEILSDEEHYPALAAEVRGAIPRG